MSFQSYPEEVLRKYDIHGVSLGSGSFGVVQSGRRRRGVNNNPNNKNKNVNNDVAFKIIPDIFRSAQDARRVLREISIMRQCVHPHLMPLVDIFTPGVSFSRHSGALYETERPAGMFFVTLNTQVSLNIHIHMKAHFFKLFLLHIFRNLQNDLDTFNIKGMFKDVWLVMENGGHDLAKVIRVAPRLPDWSKDHVHSIMYASTINFVSSLL